MLDDVRVLEVSAPETMLAGRMLADLGADVIIVEPPGGALGRRLDPFIDNVPGLERSLTWHALNNNKRSITLDLMHPDGRDLFATLARKFDIALETIAPNDVAPLADLKLDEKLIRCSISPFARTGPKSNYAASDLVVMAASGAPSMSGDPDRPPVFFPVPQAMMEAGAEAAIAALASLAARDRDALGQHAEVSARIAAMTSSFVVPIQIASGNPGMSREHAQITIAGVKLPGIFECKDGYVSVPFAFGPAFGPMTQRLAKWAADEGHLAEEVAALNWPSFPGDLAKGKARAADLDALVKGVRSLLLSKTKVQVDEMSRRLSLLTSAMLGMDDIAQSAQYRARGLFTRQTIRAADREIDVPARFAQFSNYSIETRLPAPTLSEHTFEILSVEAGLSITEIQALFVHGII